jgi:hypothetical protein
MLAYVWRGARDAETGAACGGIGLRADKRHIEFTIDGSIEFALVADQNCRWSFSALVTYPSHNQTKPRNCQVMDVEYATTVADRAIRSMSQQAVPV